MKNYSLEAKGIYTQERLDYFCGTIENKVPMMERLGKPFPLMSALGEILSVQVHLMNGGRVGLAEGDYCE